MLLLFADKIGVVTELSPNTGELGNVKFLVVVVGEFGLDFFNLCRT